MKKRKGLFLLGVLLFLAACLPLGKAFFDRVRVPNYEKILSAMDAFLPERTIGVPFERTTMSAAHLEGHDCIALLEIANQAIRVPVFGVNDPSSVETAPKQISGNVYDHSLVIQATEKQLPMAEIACDDILTVTDMRGAVFTYIVTQVTHAEKMDAELLRSEGDLLLYAYAPSVSRYIIVHGTFQ